MQFTKIRLVGLTAVDLPIIGAHPSDSYILKDADGLGPPVVDVSIADSTILGGVYQGRRPQNREMVLRVGLNQNYRTGMTAKDLREELYGLLTPGLADVIPVQLMNGNDIVAVTSGYVSKIDTVLFSKEPEVQITIPCVEPYLNAPAERVLTALSKTNPEILNEGSAPTGFRMEVRFTAVVAGGWVLTREGRAEKLFFDWPFLVGDVLRFDTRPGKRFVNLTRNGSTETLVYSLSSDSSWFELHGGVNSWLTSSANFEWVRVVYTPQYWGV